MKKLLVSALSISIILTACGQEENKEQTKNTEKSSVSENKKTDNAKKKDDKQKDAKTNEEVTSEAPTTEAPTTEIASTEQNQSINTSNVTNRSDLETIIYGNNYSELDKIAAYNSAVKNGVIPQGNVMEGPATAAYESSLRVESGQEQSVYSSNPNPDNPSTAKHDHLYKKDDNTENNITESNNEIQNTVQSNNNSGYDPNNPYMNLPNQEWRENAGGLSSGEIQTRNQILNGTYQGDDAQQKLDAINYYEQKYSK
ncbi:hypothetical protein MRN59_05920 [Macrococcoides caseolyticum]|uniref:hypothetical protein n=1 Tax=Macrococcoides caseolyticum TaxID=69966 RepID=UPI00339D3799